jgi:hypothetical protein
VNRSFRIRGVAARKRGCFKFPRSCYTEGNHLCSQGNRSTHVSKTIVVAELTTFDDQRIVFPESTWFANKGNDMLRRLQVSLQKDVLNEGMLVDAIRMSAPGEFSERHVEVSTPAGKDAQRPEARHSAQRTERAHYQTHPAIHPPVPKYPHVAK